jgi:hypothetical protein
VYIAQVVRIRRRPPLQAEVLVDLPRRGGQTQTRLYHAQGSKRRDRELSPGTAANAARAHGCHN